MKLLVLEKIRELEPLHVTRGTGDMVRRSQKAGVKTVLVTYDDSTAEN